ncbi:hypothetical protein [Cerasicoccus frondis]|uniref:hypothetical protein n=1 Tax=Cerasicoccus frondis TaxID=490090 RepID=UPI0028529E3F|nr:hypothetical protein [Cerasicoccus frondis]
MTKLSQFLITATCLTVATSAIAQHTHINAGAYDEADRSYIEIGDPLIAYNAPDEIEFDYNDGASTAGEDGFFYESDFTFAAYDSYYYNPSTQIGGAVEGSSIYIEFWGIASGPEGGAFAFYEAGATDPTFLSTVEDGQGYVGIFNLSDPALAPNAFGHIHGRVYAITKPGTYETYWKLVDENGNQTDSSVFTLTFTAVPEPAHFAMLAAVGMLALMVMRERRRSSMRR